MDAGQFVIKEGEEGEADAEAMETPSIIVSLQGPSTSSTNGTLQNYNEGEATILPIQFVQLQNEDQNQEQSESAKPEQQGGNTAEINETDPNTENQQSGEGTPEKESSVAETETPIIPHPHRSILKSANDMPLDFCQVADCTCGGQRTVIHCILCSALDSWSTKAEAAEHFSSVHLESKLEIDEDICAVLCCCADREASHYHCPYCGDTQAGLAEITQHVSACVQLWLSRRRAPDSTKPGDSQPSEEEKSETLTDKPSDLQEKLGNNYHKSIVRNLSDVKLEVCKGCCKGTRYHCPFCPYILCKPQNACKIRQHIETNHWKFKVEHEDMFLLKCTSACMGTVNGRPVGGHWHCPLCSRCVGTRQAITAHLSAHRRGTQQRRRTNADWAALLGPEDANILFNRRDRDGGQETMQAASIGVEGSEGEGYTQTEAWEQREPPAQVFQTVAALLTQEMLAAIPGSVSAYFSKLQEDSSIQFSTSDQWCLLQADWGTMSGVHEQLKGFLNSSPRAERPSGVKRELSVVERIGAGGDASSKEVPHESETTQLTSEKQTDEPIDDQSGIKSSNTNPQQVTDVQELTSKDTSDGEIEENNEGVSEQTKTSTKPTVKGNDSNLNVGQEKKGSNSDPSRKVPKQSLNEQESFTTESSSVPNRDHGTNDITNSEKIDSVVKYTESYTGQTKTEKKSSELSKSETPVKRGRGRPRKAVPEPATRDVKLETKQEKHGIMDSPETSRRRRSRLPKRFQDYETQIIDASDDKPETLTPAPSDTAASLGTTIPVAPVKRGRGRPPKRAYQEQQRTEVNEAKASEGEEAENKNHESQTNSEKSSEINGTEKEDTPDGNLSERDSSDKEESNETSPQRKKRRKGVVEAPEITISIDENTGNVLSVAVSGEASEVNETNVKQEKETDDSQLSADADELVVEGDVTGGYSLVRKRKVFVCESCGRGHPNSQRYYQHVLGSSCLEKRRKADQKFKISAELEAVIKEVRKEVTEPKCPLCQKSFKHVLHAQMHYAEKTCVKNLQEKRFGLEQNSDTGMYHCRHCDFSSGGVQRVIMHEMRKHWKKTEQCPICRKIYSSEFLLREHIKSVHARGKERAVCDQCGVTVTARLLQQHIKVKHDPTYVRPKPKPLEKPLICSECDDFQTMSYSKMKRHQAQLHRIADKQCPHCEQVFAMQGDLNRHVKLVHEGLNQATGSCPQCGKTMSKKNLSAHIRMVHEKRRPHSCPICGRAFLTKYTLQQHIDTHKPSDQRDTKFLCAFCGKGFINRTHYADHLNTHTGARPYVCNICNKTFRCNPALHKHKELHRATSLHCTICNLYFPTRKALRIHNNKEHVKSGSSTFRCVCDAEYTSMATLAQHQVRCAQWQQANPHLNPNISANHTSGTHVLDASLQDQMAMILQHSDLDQSGTGTYIVLEGKEGEETVMVLQSLENLEGAAAADVVQAVNSQILNIQPQPSDDVTDTNAQGSEVMDASGVMAIEDGSEVKGMTSSEVLATLTSAEAALTLTTTQEEEEDGEEGEEGMQAIDMGTEDQQALLAISQEVDAQQQAMAELQEAAEQQLAAQRENSLSRYLCGYCQQLFTSLEDVQTHMLADHVTADGGGEVELALHAPADVTPALEEQEEMEGVEDTGLL